MTAIESQEAFTLVQSMYPDTNRNLSDGAFQIVLREWARQFADFEAEAVFAAIEHLIATRQGAFAPTIAEIKETARHLQNPNESTFEDEWPAVLQAIQNSAYHSQESFERLSPQMKKALRSASRLRELATLDNNGLQFARNDLRKSFDAVRSREADRQKLPANVQTYIDQAAKPMDTQIPLSRPTVAAVKEEIKRHIPKREAIHGDITDRAKASAIERLRAYEPGGQSDGV